MATHKIKDDARGKMGLALSGGGFRASFFHIGLLARMADCDLLRHVEVISTVSGGSIVGAFYYVKLKRLLEEKEDTEITADDYRQLVTELIDEFGAAVKRNPRLLTFINPVKNLRTHKPNYSRTDRMGELFDALLYRPLFGEDRQKPVEMRELKIQPKGERGRFHPEQGNHSRSAKVPILLLNATTLNTGRNWRFEAIRMGEPPPIGRRKRDLDRRMQLLRPDRYHMTPLSRRDIPLGHAVAASAAVPGIFIPLPISKLYAHTRVELVDGGVHDNQGIQGLIDRGCSQLIVSDGSAQMEGERKPSTLFFHVLSRTQSILMSRLREEQILAADCRPDVDALCFIHLRKGLPAEIIPYLGRDGKPVVDPEFERVGADRCGIDKRVQEALARLRTDLDSFHEVESYSLMQSGYAIASKELRGESTLRKRIGKEKRGKWVFHVVAPLMENPTKTYLKVLHVSGSTLFKVFMIYPVLGVGTCIAVGGIIAAIVWRYRDFFNAPINLPTLVPSRLMVAALMIAAGMVAYAPIRSFLHNVRWIRALSGFVREPIRWLLRLLTRGIPSVIASFFIYAYLKLLNPLYLKAGGMERMERSMQKTRSKIIGSGVGRTPRV